MTRVDLYLIAGCAALLSLLTVLAIYESGNTDRRERACAAKHGVLVPGVGQETVCVQEAK